MSIPVQWPFRGGVESHGIEKVISGGQTGADQAGWRAAQAAGIATGGWMPKGYLTEDGPRPEFAELYGASEMPTADYGPRTDKNVQESEWVIWFGDANSAGSRRTLRACERFGTGWATSFSFDHLPPENAAYFLQNHRCRRLMIAGNRESKAPGIGAWVEQYLAEVFRLFKGDQTT